MAKLGKELKAMKFLPFIAAAGLAVSLNSLKATEEKGVTIKEPTAVLDGLSRDVLKDLRPGSSKMMDAAGEASKKAAESEGKQATFQPAEFPHSRLCLGQVRRQVVHRRI